MVDGEVGEDNMEFTHMVESMEFPHMVESMDWCHRWVLFVCVVEYEPWSQSTHKQCVMFQVFLDQQGTSGTIVYRYPHWE